VRKEFKRVAAIPKNACQEDFDQFSGKDYAGHKLTEKALEFIRTNQNKPFFLYYPSTIPHAALQVPEDSEAYKMYEN